MYGWIVRKHGGPEALEWDEALPTPEPGPRQKRLRPMVHAALPLGELPEGHRMIEAREVLGKVVLLHEG